MRVHFVLACMVVLISLAPAQQTAAPSPAPKVPPATKSAKIPEAPVSTGAPVDPKIKELFESKINAEWEALKNKDKKAYAELLAEDYQGVEVDGQGERTKIQALNELVAGNIFNYTLWGFKVIPLNPDAALVIYESTIQFPPKAQVRFSRVYISELWVKRAGQWKEVHYQETHVK
jgi:uncharacterized protein (TIGR02246 family)